MCDPDKGKIISAEPRKGKIIFLSDKEKIIPQALSVRESRQNDEGSRGHELESDTIPCK